jgi:hypothetical protein
LMLGLTLFLTPETIRAQTDHLVEFNTGRTSGTVTKTPVLMRAILSKPIKPTDTAVLFFRGIPGYARIESVADKGRNLIPFMRAGIKTFLQGGVALVIMDCPTDQWGGAGDYLPTACLDDYRSSKAHTDDVRGIMKKLREEHGLTKLYLLGHSQGTISSRWLALNLGNEIAGSIHSAAVNISNPKRQYASVINFPYARIAAPVLHVHNENDACRGTPYGAVQAYARDNLVTVRGGTPTGDPCGGTHLHSYLGREAAASSAMLTWIRTGEFVPLIGE